jgi:hypothetical protein
LSHLADRHRFHGRAFGTRRTGLHLQDHRVQRGGQGPGRLPARLPRGRGGREDRGDPARRRSRSRPARPRSPTSAWRCEPATRCRTR